MMYTQFDFSEIKNFPSVSFADELDLLPDKSGVYFVVDGDGSCVYLGRAKSIKSRWEGYHEKKHWVKIAAIVFRGEFRIHYLLTDQPKEIEKSFLRRGIPPFNNCSNCTLKDKILPWDIPDYLDGGQIKSLRHFLDLRDYSGFDALCVFIRDWQSVYFLKRVLEQCP